MKIRHFLKWSLGLAVFALFPSYGPELALAQADPAAAPNPGDIEGAEVLTRGQVHEAFAGTISFNPEPGIEVPKAPPEAIEELPPDQKPEGANVAWIPGYWAWDDDRDDFVWVSGIWRALPPGRQWIPGYWNEAGKGFQWISGYWADANVQEAEYLPQPPETMERGPNIDAPSPDDVWVPGTWIWHANRYAWQPGYWVAAQPNWIWTPACYNWSPNGYVFVNGYWDYSVARRGCLFAPIYFGANFQRRPGFVYSPMTVININVFANQLFLRPRFHHYYFGDYYASNYVSAGFYPWFSVQSRGFGYDPFFAHQRWMNRQNPNWAQSLQADFKYRVDHEDARPPRTFAAQQARFKGGKSPDNKNLVVAMSLDQAAKGQVATGDGAKNAAAPLKFQKVDKEERQKFAHQGQQVQEFRAQRHTAEQKTAYKAGFKPAVDAEGKAVNKADAKPEAVGVRAKVKLAPSPIVAQANDQSDAANAPPKPPETPKPDLKVEAKPRKADPQGRTPGRDPKQAKPEAKPDTPDEPKDEPTRKTPRKPETKPDAKPDSKPRPMPTPKVEPKPDAKPIPAPKVEPKPEPKPMPTPKVEPKPEPTPKPAPKVEPKPEPKPMPAPKVEPKPEPKPKPAPKVEPKPKRDPKPKPKDKPEPKPDA